MNSAAIAQAMQAKQLGGTPRLATPAAKPATKQEEKLLETARQFEAVFVNQLMSVMRKTVQENPLFHGGQAETMFTGMLDDTMATQAAEHGRGFGIGEQVYRQFVRQLQAEPASKPAIVASTLDTQG